MKKSGFVRVPLMSQIFNNYSLGPGARAIYNHVYEQSDFCNALANTSARRIAEEILTTRKKVLWYQAALKKVGLLTYPARFRAATRPYFISLKILDYENDKYIVTRPWGEAVREAIAAGVVDGKKHPDDVSDELLKFFSKTRTAEFWYRHTTYKRIFSKEVSSLEPETLLYHAKSIQVTTIKRPDDIDPAANMDHLDKIGKLFQGASL